MSTGRREQIASLVAEWKRGLADLGMSEPKMRHHQLLLLLAEEYLGSGTE